MLASEAVEVCESFEGGIEEKRLTNYLNGIELTDEERKEIGDHLETCGFCQRRFRQTAKTIELGW